MTIVIPNTEIILPNRVYRESLNRGKDVVYSISRYTVPSVEDTVTYLRDLLENEAKDEGECEAEDECEWSDDSCLLEILKTLPRDQQSLFLGGCNDISRSFPKDMGEAENSYLEINGGSLKLRDVNLLVENRDHLCLDDVDDLITQYGTELWGIRFRLDGYRIKLSEEELGLCLTASECDCGDLFIDRDDNVSYNLLIGRTKRFYRALIGKIPLVPDTSSEIEHYCRLKTVGGFLEELTLGDEVGIKNYPSFLSMN